MDFIYKKIKGNNSVFSEQILLITDNQDDGQDTKVIHLPAFFTINRKDEDPVLLPFFKFSLDNFNQIKINLPPETEIKITLRIVTSKTIK